MKSLFHSKPFQCFGKSLGSLITLGLLVWLLSGLANGQTAIRWDLGAPGSAGAVTTQSAGGASPLFALPGVQLAWCNHPANAVPCTNYATTYTSLTLGTSCPTSTQIVLQGSSTCVATGDNFGNLGVYTTTNTTCTITCYDYTLTVNGTSYGPFVWTQGGGSGGGGSLPTATAAGQYPNSTGAGTTYLAQSKVFVDLRDVAGVDCTGAVDSTTGLQNMINSAPDNTLFYTPRGCRPIFKGNPGLTIDSRYGLEFWMEGFTTNACDQPNGGAWVYTQTYASGNVAIYINRSQRLFFHNFVLILGGHADVGFNVDQVGATPPITTQNFWDGVCVQSNTTPNPSFRGFQFSATSLNDVEDMHLRNTSVWCANAAATGTNTNGVGYWFGPSANQKNQTLENAKASQCSLDVEAGPGSGNTFINWLDAGTFNGIDLNGFNDLVSGYRSEITHAAIGISNGVGPHLIMHNDFAVNSTGPVIDCSFGGSVSGCGATTLIGNETDLTLSSGDWFNTSGGNLQGPLFAAGNRSFAYNPQRWVLGSSVFANLTTITDPQLRQFSGQQRTTNTHTVSEWFQPPAPGTSSQNVPSPPLEFTSLSGNSNVEDDFFVQNLSAGAAGTPTASTFGIFHNPVQTTITPWLAFQGTQSGATYAQIGTPLAPAVTPQGTTGATNYSYVVVAYGATGTSVGSSAGSTSAGNATLSSTNYNQLSIRSVAGAVQYDIYRTVGGATQGKINLVPFPGYCGTGVLCVASGLIFNDTGLTGDGTSAPVSNTTAQVTSTVPTGLAPFSITSTTPVANLTTVPTTYNHSGTQQTGVHIVIDSCTLGTNCSVTLTGSSVFTSSSSYQCGALDTTAANAIKFAPSSGSAFALTGTGTDVLSYICIGD